ncbi:MAG: hypothetical protein ACRCVW_02165 [Brevinema sp.]
MQKAIDKHNDESLFDLAISLLAKKYKDDIDISNYYDLFNAIETKFKENIFYYMIRFLYKQNFDFITKEKYKNIFDAFKNIKIDKAYLILKILYDNIPNADHLIEVFRDMRANNLDIELRYFKKHTNPQVYAFINKYHEQIFKID